MIGGSAGSRIGIGAGSNNMMTFPMVKSDNNHS